MESQNFEYWQPQQDAYTQPPATYYEYTPDLTSIPSLSASPLPVTPGDFGPSDDGSGGVVTAGALPSPPYMCSPQQSNADLGYSLSPESATFPLHIVNEQGFGQGRAPVRSASNGSTWSAGSSAAGGSAGVQPDRTHVTSGRRRAQNRAAQRAFRERKEKHAKDLETQLALLSEKYGKLEASHAELNTAYEKLRRTLELLMSSSGSPDDDPDDDDDGEEMDAEGDVVIEGVDAEALARALRRRDWADARGGGGAAAQKETLRKLVGILHGGVGEAGAARRRVKCEG
ncbi:Basic-leucine zipper (bZIP) transcription factor [Neofusicoccum parvum]|uniref:Basic-leucine zipper (BZIP) transcription factor n=1 Tax=Neofusicoccum parvum TaxID=310453 RepID=A0ACB5SFL4_9PEZI|nr:Basic-leucine zipper (bZIP) transcription factor [Neofusicoccum parvum]